MALKHKLFVAPVVALGVVVGSSTAAFAHHCYNASRSDQGNAGASQSNGWFTLTLADLYAEVAANPGDFGLTKSATPAQITAIIAAARQAGVPDSFVVLAHATAANGTLKKSEPTQATDGKGIDFFDSAYGGALIGAYIGVVGV